MWISVSYSTSRPAYLPFELYVLFRAIFFSPEVGTRERSFGSVRLEEAAENMAISVGSLQKLLELREEFCKQPWREKIVRNFCLKIHNFTQNWQAQ